MNRSSDRTSHHANRNEIHLAKDHRSANGHPPARSGATSMVLLVVLLYSLALLLAVVLVFRGQIELGLVGAMLVLTMSPVAFALVAGPGLRLQRELLGRTTDLHHAIRETADQAALSDDARKVLNRQRERELLCNAIEEDISGQNWDAAMVLIKELADGFGYRADAEAFRRKIEEAREQDMNEEIDDAVSYLDGLILQRRWDGARLDAARITRLYPYSPRVEGLRSRVDQALDAYKSDLERRFLVASQEGRHDDAMSLLKELDQHLTVAEAEPLRELAKGVITKARENLGAQFKLAVQDRRWAEAVPIGERIIAEFPNSRMAAEVRNIIDNVRQKMSQPV